jgi:hypothetical protein
VRWMDHRQRGYGWLWAEKRTRESAPRVALLALLKTFQRLGYTPENDSNEILTPYMNVEPSSSDCGRKKSAIA